MDFVSKAQVMTLMTTDVARVGEFAMHTFNLIGECFISRSFIVLTVVLVKTHPSNVSLARCSCTVSSGCQLSLGLALPVSSFRLIIFLAK